MRKKRENSNKYRNEIKRSGDNNGSGKEERKRTSEGIEIRLVEMLEMKREISAGRKQGRTRDFRSTQVGPYTHIQRARDTVSHVDIHRKTEGCLTSLGRATRKDKGMTQTDRTN